MSLLEDVFLQDEANEAQELERVIEGGDFEQGVVSNSDDNSEKEDEAEEDKRRVDPGSTKIKRVVKNPRFILNPARLTGPRGIQVIPEHFKDFKFNGKGHEKEDLDLVLKKLEHWAYRLYPKFKFEDCLKKIETLGKKRPVMVHLQKIRSDQFVSDELVVQKDSSDEETAEPEPDEFDKLLQQQIELARATPAPANRSIDTAVENRSLVVPKATSSPSISEEQKERMLRNRKLAEERRLAKLNNSSSTTPNNSNITNVCEVNNYIQGKTKEVSSDEENAGEMNEGQAHKYEELEPNSILQKKGKPNVIDSSDEISDNEIIALKNSSKDDNIDKDTAESQGKKRKANILDSSDDKNHDHTGIYFEKENISEQIDSDSARVSLKNNVSEATIESNEFNDGFKQNENNGLNRSSGLDIRDVVLENSIIQSTIQGLVENDNNINLERDLNNGVNSSENEGLTNVNERNEELMDVDFSEDF
ncbi:TIMELESS-interacting protein [Pieris brassicae]|uniref:TIMELESS-interacting protein n=1 Tax=Pieris brassicae TaxID=7116 RepID=UPI001E661AAC|nr:TIMELESS-interacting protein [Pieris brassicae]